MTTLADLDKWERNSYLGYQCDVVGEQEPMILIMLSENQAQLLGKHYQTLISKDLSRITLRTDLPMLIWPHAETIPESLREIVREEISILKRELENQNLTEKLRAYIEGRLHQTMSLARTIGELPNET